MGGICDFADDSIFCLRSRRGANPGDYGDAGELVPGTCTCEDRAKIVLRKDYSAPTRLMLHGSMISVVIVPVLWHTNLCRAHLLRLDSRVLLDS